MSRQSFLRTGLIVLLFCLGLMALPMIVGAIAPEPGAEGAAPLAVTPPETGLDGAGLRTGAQVRVTGTDDGATVWISSTCHTSGSQGTWAGLFDIEVRSPSGTWSDSQAYCTDLCNPVIYNTTMDSCGNTGPQIAYILANYYPAKSQPSGLTNNQKAAAVQAAIWYFSDGATLLNTTPSNIRDATAAIIAAANAGAGVTVVPETLTLTPASETNNTNFETTHTVTATLIGSNGLPMQGATINFRTTSSSNNPNLSGTGVTNASGQCTWTYTNTHGGGNDTIQAYTNNYTTPRGLQFCYPLKQKIVLAGDPQSFRAETTASKKWVDCPDYDVTLLSYTVNCATNKTEYIYKVQGNGGSGTSLSHWALELCSALPTSISGYQVYKSSSCTNPVWTLMSSGVEYKAAGSANNDLSDACGLSVPSLKINESVDKNGCEAFKIVINGLWTAGPVHWAGKGGNDDAGGTCAYCEGGVIGPSCTPYTVPCAVDGPSSGCAGESLTYTYTGGATSVTFKWYVDNVEQAGQTGSTFNWTAVSGSHTIKLRVTDANGCYNECSISVTGNPAPVCGISGPSSGCFGRRSVPHPSCWRTPASRWSS